MRPAARGYRVAIVGASSLLGKELLAVLEDRNFPVSRLVTFEADEEEPDLPIIDLREHAQTTVTDEDIADAELDFAFLAARLRESPRFLRVPGDGLPGPRITSPPHCTVIDLGEGPGEAGTLTVPFLDRSVFEHSESKLFVSAHPAAIVISTLLLRLAARFPLKGAVAQVFVPASEIGPQAIEELQKQTVNLLSFHKIPESIFGTQLAFNLLPRLGRGRRRGTRRAGAGELSELENRVRKQLRDYLADRVPQPAVRLCQAPVFHSLAFSLYVETLQPATPEALGAALAGDRLRLRRPSEQAPSQVEASGSSDILVDAITSDPAHPGGIWIWAAVDNLRLAAVNAVEIAEGLSARVRS